jgi:hypothetical protein
MNLISSRTALETIEGLIPDNLTRRYCVDIFIESVAAANAYGPGKWAITMTGSAVSLVVGEIVVAALVRDGLWLSLDGDEDLYDQVDQLPGWEWDDGHFTHEQVSSMNGYFEPSPDRMNVWRDALLGLHVTLIGRAAGRAYSASPDGPHAPGVLAYLDVVKGTPLPRPQLA